MVCVRSAMRQPDIDVLHLQASLALFGPWAARIRRNSPSSMATRWSDFPPPSVSALIRESVHLRAAPAVPLIARRFTIFAPRFGNHSGFGNHFGNHLGRILAKHCDS